jgi:hypothetical protein
MKKQDLLADINQSIIRVNDLISREKKTTQISGKDIIYFPLFFYKDTASPFMDDCIDSCALSIGLMSYKLLNDKAHEDKSIVDKAIRGILKMRNDDKSWASVMDQENKKKQFNGTINDTCFALTALNTCSFLDEKYLYDQKILSEFKINNLADRIMFVLESVKWLNDNKINNGWYYTSTKHFTDINSIIPTATSTIRVINTLYTILNKLQALRINIDIQQKDIDFIKSLIQNAVDTLFAMRKICGAFSKKIDDFKSITQTSNALAILLQLDTEYTAKYEPLIKSSIKWFLSNIEKIYDTSKIDATDYIDRYSQIIEENQKIKTRLVVHETHIDSHVFYALLKISQSEKYIKYLSLIDKIKLYSHIKKSLHHLLKLQTDNERYSGAFECRRTEKYSIYSTYHAIIGLKDMQENLDKFYESYLMMNKYVGLCLLLISVVIIIIILIFGSNTSVLVALILAVVGNIITQPILKKMDFML